MVLSSAPEHGASPILIESSLTAIAIAVAFCWPRLCSTWFSRVVRALEGLLLKRGPDAFEVSDLPPINYETLAELRRRLAQEPMIRDAHAG